MELHPRSCVLPSNAPALSEAGSTIPSRVLQERSGNRRHGYAAGSSSWKRLPSSPVENLYSHSLGGGYFTGNLASQLSGEKSEEQIEKEARKLIHLVECCEKYQKYRERQPTNAKEKEQKWPDVLEHAFFRALVRWPPMGRRKHMLEGQLRGRNELVADSIEKETGVPRTRKQVSSHIQVLKNIFVDQPGVLLFMSKEDLGKSRKGSSSYGHLRNRLQSSKYNFNQRAGNSCAPLQNLSNIHSHINPKPEVAYTITQFAILVEANKQPVHYVTQLAENARLPDLNFTDTTSWHKQYPELNFHRTEEWKDRQIIVCDASIKIMRSASPPGAEISVYHYFESQHDLSALEPLRCRTRFYDGGELADQFPNGDKHPPQKESWGDCAYDHAPSDRSRKLRFGSVFWARRMSSLRQRVNACEHEEPKQRGRLEINVRKDVQYMTAVQDIYGTKSDTGEKHCFLTILWRFHQTRNPNEPGKMTWRVVNLPPPAQPSWVKGEETDTAKDLRFILNSTTSSVPASIYPSLPLEFPHQPFAHHPPQLDLDSLSAISIDALCDFSNPNSASTHNMVADYSHTQSLPRLVHSQDTHAAHAQDYQDPNDIDFTGGHINLHLGPAINFGTYDSYTTHTPALNTLNPIGSLEPTHPDTSFGDLGLGVAMTSCYPSKPWHYNDLISRIEGAAEQSQDMFGQTTTAQDQHVVGHGVLHDGQMAQGLWKLQTGFGEDTGVGAVHDDGRKEHHAQGILDMIERDHRAEDERVLGWRGWRERAEG